jgi:hypothetical protein
MVPQHPVTAIGDGERDRELGIVVEEIDRAALLVEHPVRVLSEAIEPLAIPGDELLGDPASLTSHGCVGSPGIIEADPGRHFLENRLLAPIEETDAPVGQDLGPDPAVLQDAGAILDPESGVRLVGREETRVRFPDRPSEGGTYAYGALPPRLHPPELGRFARRVARR